MMISKFVLLLAAFGFALIASRGASAQGFGPFGPFGPDGPYGPPPMGEYYGPPMVHHRPPVGRGSDGVDHGGRWEDYTAMVDRSKRSSRSPHRVDYVCKSFCTLWLGGNACVTREARFGFHGISYGGPDSQNIDPKGNAMFLRRLPRQIQAWVIRHHALASKAITWMSGNEAIALGIRECR